MLTPGGEFRPTEAAEPYLAELERLSEHDHRGFYRDMVVSRAFDQEATNLQRQGQLALWPPSHGQEAAQVGSAHAARPQDHVFPSYREHVVCMIRGVDPMGIVAVMRGTTKAGWDPSDPANGNVRLYSLVLGSQTLHATGFAMGMKFDGSTATGDPSTDEALLVYFGDGASSQGDVNEALVFASSYQTPQVFFLQNNHWAISVPVSTQSRTPLHLRASGFGMPGVRLDGNDVLASYAVTAKHLDDARAGHGPSLIEALTYRMGAHTTSDDPTRYRPDDEVADWRRRDPIARFRAYLEGLGAPSAFFDSVDEEAADVAADTRTRTLALEPPAPGSMFETAYSEPHTTMVEQGAWFERYERSFDAASTGAGA
jgi:2-oxoisovalerate dehydrogenase E1 component alpha subunit